MKWLGEKGVVKDHHDMNKADKHKNPRKGLPCLSNKHEHRKEFLVIDIKVTTLTGRFIKNY